MEKCGYVDKSVAMLQSVAMLRKVWLCLKKVWLCCTGVASRGASTEDLIIGEPLQFARFRALYDFSTMHLLKQSLLGDTLYYITC